MTTTSYISKKQSWNNRSEQTEWILRSTELQSILQSGEKKNYPYREIDSIRLYFDMGGRTSFRRYCCYFSVNGTSHKTQFICLQKTDEHTEQGILYSHFVKQLIENIQKQNPNLKLIVGHSKKSLYCNIAMLVFMTLIIAFAFGFNHYSKNILGIDSEVYGTRIILLFILVCIPFVLSMIFYYPKNLKPNQPIPETVLPKTEHKI